LLPLVVFPPEAGSMFFGYSAHIMTKLNMAGKRTD
jgi:hypothetical protein